MNADQSKLHGLRLPRNWAVSKFGTCKSDYRVHNSRICMDLCFLAHSAWFMIFAFGSCHVAKTDQSLQGKIGGVALACCQRILHSHFQKMRLLGGLLQQSGPYAIDNLRSQCVFRHKEPLFRVFASPEAAVLTRRRERANVGKVKGAVYLVIKLRNQAAPLALRMHPWIGMSIKHPTEAREIEEHAPIQISHLRPLPPFQTALSPGDAMDLTFACMLKANGNRSGEDVLLVTLSIPVILNDRSCASDGNLLLAMRSKRLLHQQLWVALWGICDARWSFAQAAKGTHEDVPNKFFLWGSPTSSIQKTVLLHAVALMARALVAMVVFLSVSVPRWESRCHWLAQMVSP